MSFDSLAAAPLSDNDVPILATLFEVSIDFFRKHKTPHAADFIYELKTMAGLGFTAVLVDNGGIAPYQRYLNQFIGAEKDIFIKTSHNSTFLLSNAMANMVIWSLGSFRRLVYPNYYSDFSHSLEKAIKNVRVDLAGKSEEARRLLLALPNRCVF